MATLKDLFFNLKTGIIGTKSSIIDTQIDRSLKTLANYTSTNNRNTYQDTIKKVLNATSTAEGEDLLKDLNKIGGIENLSQGARLARYNEYEQIVRNISYCKRALTTITDNIISPDDITKKIIQIVVDENKTVVDKTGAETIITRLKKIKSFIDVENYTDRLVQSTLEKGDYFIEIVNTKKGKNILNILQESKESQDSEYFEYEVCDLTESSAQVEEDSDENEIDISTGGKVIITELSPLGGTLSEKPPVNGGPNAWNTSTGLPITHKNYEPHPISLDPHSAHGPETDPYEENLDDEDKFKNKYSDDIKKSKSEVDKLSNLYIVLHDPKYVVKLQTERFRFCLGYLVFPKYDAKFTGSNSWTAQSNDVDSICLKILEKIQTKMIGAKDSLPETKELKEVIKNYLTNVKKGDDLKIRYVPADLMSHWKLHSDLFDPYGESIFECVKFDCKLLMALKTAQTVKTLTSSTDKRVIKVETGLTRDASNLIQIMKEALRKGKISLDQFGSVDTIPSMISTFEDIYVPTKDGKAFVEFDNINFGSNPDNDTEKLKFIRDNIVANLNVPPAAIGLEENVSNKSLLTEENILFARSIISYQKQFSHLLKDLFEKIYNLLYPDCNTDLDNIIITFPPPKAGPYEHQMEYIEQMVRIVEALDQLGVPKTYTKKKYLPDLNWEEIDKEAAKSKVEKELGSKSEPDDLMGGMGLGGGGFGGLPQSGPTF